MGQIWQPDLFDVEEIVRINEEIKEKEHYRLNMIARKSLNPPYYDDPQNDNERLLNYQYEYLKNDNQYAWGQLIELSFIVAKRLVWKWMKQKRVRLDEIEQDEKTSIAVEYVLRRYKTNIGYCINTNYISALKDGVKHAMLYITKLDMETTYMSDVMEKSMEDADMDFVDEVLERCQK